MRLALPTAAEHEQSAGNESDCASSRGPVNFGSVGNTSKYRGCGAEEQNDSKDGSHTIPPNPEYAANTKPVLSSLARTATTENGWDSISEPGALNGTRLSLAT